MQINPNTLTPAQLDGFACAVCAGEDGIMAPVGTVDGGQVFAHAECLPTAERVGVPTEEELEERYLATLSEAPEVDVEDGPCLRGISHIGECVYGRPTPEDVMAEIERRVQARREELSRIVDEALATFATRAGL